MRSLRLLLTLALFVVLALDVSITSAAAEEADQRPSISTTSQVSQLQQTGEPQAGSLIYIGLFVTVGGALAYRLAGAQLAGVKGVSSATRIGGHQS